MSKYPTIISYYTNNWEYPKYAEAMQKSCKRYGLDSHIVNLEDKGHWIQNTKLKPKFIYETVLKLKRPVLWIDVDGSLLAKPQHFKDEYKYDFAAKKMPEHRTRMWHVGTMYFAYNERVVDFLEEWYARSIDAKATDEAVLDELWKDQDSSIHNLSIDELPESYFYMLRGLTGQANSNTVIAHRASRDESKMRMKERNKNRRTEDKDRE